MLGRDGEVGEVSALSDMEDDLPHVRARQPSVEVLEELAREERETDAEQLRTEHAGFAAEADSLKRTHDALAALRNAVEANTRETKGMRRQLAALGVEMGDRKDWESALALELASLRGLNPNGLTGKRVLVVDDSEYFLDMCEHVLGELGCNVTAASSRGEAEKLLVAMPRQFHLALVDLHLPPMANDPPASSEGLELCRWILNAHPPVRVIVMSGRLEAEGLDTLPVARLQKPISIATIKAAMYGALGMVDVESQTIAPPAHGDVDDVAEDDTAPSIILPELPSTGRETPEAKRE